MMHQIQVTQKVKKCNDETTAIPECWTEMCSSLLWQAGVNVKVVADSGKPHAVRATGFA